MEAYLEFLTVTLMTAITVAVVGLVVAEGYSLYKFLKEEL